MSSSVTELPLDDALEGDIGDYKSNSLWRLTLRRLFRQRSAIVGGVILLVLVFTAIFADFIAPYDPTDVLIGVEDVKKRQAPCIHLLGCPEDQPQHIMGTDGNVRDVFSRVVHGARISLRVGFLTVGFAIIVGTTLGALSGYFGGWVDNTIMRVLDVVLAFPFLILAIAIVSVLGPGLTNTMLAIAIVSIPAYARVTRSSVLSVREQSYVEASRALGASNFEILFRRILPNALPPLIVIATLGIATAILETAALSFIGLGAQPPLPEWGAMLAGERNQLFSAPHLVFFPGLAIMVTVLAFNLIGDGLRDALDPRLAHAGVKSE
ncbi:MAG: ABC transporter permease [Chloroflexota bacterium]|jgi:ABC-type dipeptide/oligopeptide/nickel transport system permease subunit